MQRYDSTRSGFYEAIRAPWSPNLLPTVALRDVPPAPEPRGGFLFALRLPGPEVARPDVGFLEEDEAGAQRALLTRAGKWLHEHGPDPGAWEQVQDRTQPG